MGTSVPPTPPVAQRPPQGSRPAAGTLGESRRGGHPAFGSGSQPGGGGVKQKAPSGAAARTAPGRGGLRKAGEGRRPGRRWSAVPPPRITRGNGIKRPRAARPRGLSPPGEEVGVVVGGERRGRRSRPPAPSRPSPPRGRVPPPAPQPSPRMPGRGGRPSRSRSRPAPLFGVPPLPFAGLGLAGTPAGSPRCGWLQGQSRLAAGGPSH